MTNKLTVNKKCIVRGHPWFFEQEGIYLGEGDGRGYFKLSDGSFAAGSPVSQLREYGKVTTLNEVSSGVLGRINLEELSEKERKNLETLIQKSKTGVNNSDA